MPDATTPLRLMSPLKVGQSWLHAELTNRKQPRLRYRRGVRMESAILTIPELKVPGARPNPLSFSHLCTRSPRRSYPSPS